MSNERQPESPQEEPHREKQTMTEPQEEFIGDEPQPSRDISELKDAPAKVKKAS